MLKCSTCPYLGDSCGQPTACPLKELSCGFGGDHVAHTWEDECGEYLCSGVKNAPNPEYDATFLVRVGLREDEFLVRLSLREVKKLEYLARKQRKTQEKRNRPDDVQLLENIEDKLQRVRLAI